MYMHTFICSLQHQFNKMGELLVCWRLNFTWWELMDVEAAGAAIAEPGSLVLLKLERFLYCKRSATHSHVPVRLENDTNKHWIYFLSLRQLLGSSPGRLWSKLKPSIWSVHKYALTHSTPTFGNANVTWSTRGHLKEICFHGLTCKRAGLGF